MYEEFLCTISAIVLLGLNHIEIKGLKLVLFIICSHPKNTIYSIFVIFFMGLVYPP